MMHLAAGLASEHRESVIELLIEYRADLNCPGKSENTQNVRPIHLAAMWGYDLTVKLLLYHGADASLRDSNGLSAVDYASIFDNYLCISLLLRYGSLNSTTSAWSAIMDSSLGEANDADTSSIDETCLYMTALDLGGDVTTNRDQTIQSEKLFLDAIIDHRIAREEARNRLHEEDHDPLDDIKDEDIDLNIDPKRLRTELLKLGRRAGPITDTTKKIYAKLLVHLNNEDKELVYSPRTKTKSELNGFSVELTSVLTGKFPIKQAIDLEKEFLQMSGTRDYHGPKQFFNYILIDPRITKNLPEQALEASDSDTSGHQLSPGSLENPRHAMRKVNRKFNPKLFSTFLEGIFYIGKGQKRRDLMHLYDALADRGSITHKKIDRIRSIWDDGYGVVSLHLFHNITSKEALTREALMIETIGLDNLTNLLRGTIQFKLGWNEHKRRLLGSLLLHRAYTQLLNEGERQLRRNDLKVEK